MPPRKKPQQLDLVEQANALPPAGHNSELTDDALIAENFKLEDHVKAESEKFAAFCKPFKDRIAEIEGILRTRLLERKADSTKTDSGTAYFSNLMNTKVENPEALFDFVADNWADVGADAKINIPVGKVREWMDEHEGNPPPGMSTSYFLRLNIKRS